MTSLSLPFLYVASFVIFQYAFSTSLEGQLSLYLDNLCTQPLATNPSVYLALSTCHRTPGVSSILVQSQPSCVTSKAVLTAYKDTACVNAIGADVRLLIFPCSLII